MGEMMVVAVSPPQEDECGVPEKNSKDVYRGEKEMDIPIPPICEGFFSSMINTYDQLKVQHLGNNKRENMTTDDVLKSFGYNVLGNLGKGAYGQVKLATSKKHPNKLAIKIMDCRLMKHRIVSTFLPRELKILRTVRHPHIVEVHDILEMDYGQVFIVMDAASTTLQAKIKKLGHIPISQAKTWFSQLLSAMVYLHQQDIVHRDLKCANVLLTANDQIKLTDFGFGRFSKGFPDLSYTYCCTPSYASPEIRRCVPYDAKKADVWNLGVILYMMVTGTKPIFLSDQNKYEHFHQKSVEYPEGIVVEENCRSVISSMLQYSPFARPSMAELEEHPWLQSNEECELKEKHIKDIQQQQQQTADIDSGEKEQEISVPSIFKDLFNPIYNTNEQISIKHSEKAQVIGRFIVEAVDNQDRQDIFQRDINLLQEDDGSPAAASVSHRSEEVVEEMIGCFSSLYAAVKRAAKACVAAPILRASQSLNVGVRKLFRVTRLRRKSSTTAQQGDCHF